MTQVFIEEIKRTLLGRRDGADPTIYNIALDILEEDSTILTIAPVLVQEFFPACSDGQTVSDAVGAISRNPILKDCVHDTLKGTLAILARHAVKGTGPADAIARLVADIHDDELHTAASIFRAAIHPRHARDMQIAGIKGLAALGYLDVIHQAVMDDGYLGRADVSVRELVRDVLSSVPDRAPQFYRALEEVGYHWPDYCVTARNVFT